MTKYGFESLMRNSEYLDKLTKEVVANLIETAIPELAKRESGCYSSIEILMYLMRNFEQTATLHLATNMYESQKEKERNRRGVCIESEQDTLKRWKENRQGK